MSAPLIPIRSPHALGEAISRLRIQRDLTQDELAGALGVDRRYVYEIESGRPTLYATRLFEALRVLGAHVELVPEDRDENLDD